MKLLFIYFNPKIITTKKHEDERQTLKKQR